MQLQLEMIQTIASRYGATTVSAGEFFVSWNSVATLAYTGFSRTLLAIKRAIEEGIPGLKGENPGSKWPKTTLGCLREGVELSEDQAHALRRVCMACSSELKQIPEVDRTLDVAELSCVTFLCRTLERRLTSVGVPLRGKQTEDDEPPKSHQDAVAGTMAQFAESAHQEYYPRLAPKGRTIASYYRAPHIEATLVHDLRPSARLVDVIDDFRQEVDAALPDCYEWFDPCSWHMTVRALITEE